MSTVLCLRHFVFFISLLSCALLLSSCATKETTHPFIPPPNTPSPMLTMSKSEALDKLRHIQVNRLTEGTLVYASGVPLSLQEFAGITRVYDYILIGEQHNELSHHLMQAQLITALVQYGNPPAIGLEMVPATLQPVLDRFNNNSLSVDALEMALEWEKIWGFTFSLYAPIFEVAKQYNLPVYGLNISNTAVADIRQKNGTRHISVQTKKELPEKILFPPKAQQNKLRSFFTAHAKQAMTTQNTPNSTNITRFILIQSVWDSVMAKNAATARAHSGKPVVIIAGGMHVGYHHGISYRLPIFDHSAKALLVMPATTKLQLNSAAADIFYSPKLKRQTLGIQFVPDTHVRKNNINEAGSAIASGAVVQSVVANSRAQQAGIKKGDRISHYNGVEIHKALDMHTAAIRGDKSGTIGIIRGAQSLTLQIQ